MRKCGHMPLFMLLTCCFALAVLTEAQQSSSESTRKVVRKVEPHYPEMAKKMNISGTVKLVAVVAPNGTVKTVELVGGSPLLAQASEQAVKEWKFSPAAVESKELIELHFVR